LGRLVPDLILTLATAGGGAAARGSRGLAALRRLGGRADDVADLARVANRVDDIGDAARIANRTDEVADVARVGDNALSIPTPREGMRVWRVHGQQLDDAGNVVQRRLPDGTVVPAGSRPGGASWTPVDPQLSPNFRIDAGLPNENPGRFMSEGILRNPENVTDVRPALPLDGNPGGWPEYLIRDADNAVELTSVRGVNEPWTHGPGDWRP
ncbi:MAG: hypothetical protein ACRDKB_13955, partial [Actinomycetota bacterium]